MRRKTSSEQFLTSEFKPIHKKARSPMPKKIKSKAEGGAFSLMDKGKSKIHRGHDVVKVESRGDSYDSTINCTNSRSRLTKQRARLKGSSVRQEQKMSSEDVMQLIHDYATKIQRQWRVFSLRKRFKKFIAQSRSRRTSSHQSPRSQKPVSRLEFDEKRIQRLSFLSSDCNQEPVSSYNLQKYESEVRLQANQSQRSLPRGEVSIAVSHGLQSQNQSQAKSAREVGHPKSIKSMELADRRSSLDNYANKPPDEKRRHSMGTTPSRELRALQIDKAYDVVIAQKAKESTHHESLPLQSVSKDSPNKFRENDKNAFNTKYSMDKMLHQCKKDLQVHKKKSLLTIQSRFKRNEVTERTYMQLVDRINKQHNTQLRQFKEKEGELMSSWNQLLKLSKMKVTRFAEDSHTEHLHSISGPDVSMSFDGWDFNSSAKKSMDNPLQFTDLAHSSRVLSLQSVLRELQEEEKQQKKFKKIRSLDAIEAIAERSKQISDKEAESMVQSAKQPQKLTPEHNSIKIQEGDEESHEEEVTEFAKVTIQTPKVSLMTPKKDQVCQLPDEPILPMPSKQKQPQSGSSLYISNNDGTTAADRIFSDKVIPPNDERPTVRDLVLREFAPSAKVEEKEDALVRRFAELVNEKVILNNVKMINSVKFMFARMAEHVAKLKEARKTKYHVIEADISGINTWLLEICHFMLDNYQKQIRENLVTVKQPAAIELLQLARKGMHYPLRYETIQEFVFKDFEFYYIKTVAKSNQIDPEHYDAFSTLLYTFHRNLVDSLNIALQDELLCGRRWLEMPWRPQFRKKRKVGPQHAKSCLEKAINVVSNWGEYGLGRIASDEEVSSYENQQYQDEKIVLVSRQEVLDYPLNSALTEAQLLLKITQAVWEEEANRVATQLTAFSH